ncbi:MAG: polysaccharide deacetylase family protein [Anaerolineae bacterium]|nr:polysaccharide deacetylase family protein [Anaerolineae bacterium]
MLTFILAPIQSAQDLTLRRLYVPILMYHYVSPLPANADEYRVDLTVEPAIFRAHLQYLADEGYTTISLYQLNEALINGVTLPDRPIILTFDDGHIDHYTEVFPALTQHGFTATFFVITGLADQSRSDYLSWAQIQEMSNAGMSMEAHTKSHAPLVERNRDFLIYEILGSLESLGAHTGHAPSMFAYPGGRYDDATLSLLRETPVQIAVTTRFGAWHTSDNRLELPRLRVSGNLGVIGLAQLLNSDR